MVVPEFVSYKSFDGLEIPAFLYRPEKSNGAAILYPHGGPKDQYVFGWDELAQYFTAKGYTYLAPNYRGSTGYGRNSNVPITTIGVSAIRRIVCTAQNICEHSKKSSLIELELQAEVMAVT